MNARPLHIAFALLFTLNLLISGCKKKCILNPTKIGGLTTNQLQIVDSTDANIPHDLFNRYVVKFNDDFTLAFYEIKDNRYFETPIYTGTYNITADGKTGTVVMTLRGNNSGS